MLELWDVVDYLEVVEFYVKNLFYLLLGIR